MVQPHLIVIAGPPAAGKTTLAHQIARALRLPVICKDTLKETLFDHLGAGDRARSQQLGYAVIRCMIALAKEILLAGASVILEGPFIHPDTPGELQKLLESTCARLSVVYCTATPEVLAARFNARSQATRHPGHLDGVTSPATFVHLGYLNRPDYPGQVISVDTTDFNAVSVAAIVARLGDPCSFRME
jgi:predicted kinase